MLKELLTEDVLKYLGYVEGGKSQAYSEAAKIMRCTTQCFHNWETIPFDKRCVWFCFFHFKSAERTRILNRYGPKYPKV